MSDQQSLVLAATNPYDKRAKFGHRASSGCATDTYNYDTVLGCL